jgi:thiol-disulfide isomerase/thioredoxin
MRSFKKAVLAVLLLGISATNIFAQENKPSVQNIGDHAPPLYIKKWLKGKEFKSLSKGNVYVVEFWATWCKPCIAGMPHLSALATAYKGRAEFIGISIMERKSTPLAFIEAFVKGMGDKMAYNVALEDSTLMADRWLKAFGERGIPQAFVVDRQGKIAWIGLPNQLEKVLPAIVSGQWDITTAAAKRKEFMRLTAADQNQVVTRINPLMGNPGKPEEALAELVKLEAAYPGIKYYYNTGHFTFWSLIKTNPDKALEFGKEWIAASDEPRYSTITDAVTDRKNLPAGLYVLAADAYQAQLDRYPWSMNFKETYKKMADLYTLAGMKDQAQKLLAKVALLP